MSDTTSSPQGFAALYEFNQPVVRELDLGGMVAALAGVKVPCYVNKPGIREAFAEREGRIIRTDYDKAGEVTHSEVVEASGPDSYARHRRAVALMFGQPLEKVQTLDDDKLLWLFNQGFRLVNEFNAELKNSNGGSPTPTPSAAD